MEFVQSPVDPVAIQAQTNAITAFEKNKGWPQLVPLEDLTKGHIFSQGLFGILQFHGLPVQALRNYTLGTPSPLTAEWDGALYRQLLYRLQNTPYADRLGRSNPPTGTAAFYHLWALINPTTAENKFKVTAEFQTAVLNMPVDPTMFTAWEKQVRISAQMVRTSNVGGADEMLRTLLIQGIPLDYESGLAAIKHKLMLSNDIPGTGFDAVMDELSQFQRMRTTILKQQNISSIASTPHITLPNLPAASAQALKSGRSLPDTNTLILTLLTKLIDKTDNGKHNKGRVGGKKQLS